MILRDLIQPNLIMLDLNCADRLSALSAMIIKLETQNYVKPTYRQGLLDREANFPTGLELGVGYHIAIPHTDAQHVNKSAICLGHLINPVYFQRMDNPEDSVAVEVIFMIALQQQDKQVDILPQLLTLFSDQVFMKKLKEARTKRDIILLFNTL